MGVSAGFCECQKDSVAIQMSLFMSEAAPRVRRMIREAEASSSDESESDSESGSSSEDSDDSDSEAEGSEDEAPAKPVKRKGKAGAKKPLVSGGRGMTAVVGPASKGRGGGKGSKKQLVSGGRSMAAVAAPASRGRPRGKAPAKPAAKAAAKPAGKRGVSNPAPKKAQRKQQPRAEDTPAKQPARRSASRKPVGTVSRAVGKRAASLPARLLPMKGGGLKRSHSAKQAAARLASASRGQSSLPSKAASTARGRPPGKASGRATGRKRSPVSANTRAAASAGSAKRQRTESGTLPTPARRHADDGAQQRREVRLDAAKAAAAKRVVQRARQPSPRAAAAAQGSMLGRMLTLTARAAEAAKGFLGGGGSTATSTGLAAGPPGLAQSLVMPACSVRLVPKGSLCSPAASKPCQVPGSPKVLREVPRRPRSVRLVGGGGRKIVGPTSDLAPSPVRHLQVQSNSSCQTAGQFGFLLPRNQDMCYSPNPAVLCVHCRHDVYFADFCRRPGAQNCWGCKSPHQSSNQAGCASSWSRAELFSGLCSLKMVFSRCQLPGTTRLYM